MRGLLSVLPNVCPNRPVTAKVCETAKRRPHVMELGVIKKQSEAMRAIRCLRNSAKWPAQGLG